MQAIRLHPEFYQVAITTSCDGSSAGWFDARKLERALFNLLLNACESVIPESGSVNVGLREVHNGVEIRVSDSGRGIPELIQGRLFEPFVSLGKENGTGLGLTVVQKIVQDHGGDVAVEKTSSSGTVFRVLLPLKSAPDEAVDLWLEGKARTGLEPTERPRQT
jgi:signal transduction histidine kinase